MGRICGWDQLASRISANLSNPLAVRGAALKPANFRLGKGSARSQVKPLEVWREVVNKRYNAEAKFLNLEVRQSSTPFIDRHVNFIS